MEVKINRDIRTYSETIFFGLTMRQCIFSLAACIIAVFLYFTFKNKLGTDITSWICIIGVLPFAALGFIKYNGMNFETIFLSILKTKILTPKNLVNKPTNFYYELLKEEYKKIQKEELRNDEISKKSIFTRKNKV